jgi:hypothetical protein
MPDMSATTITLVLHPEQDVDAEAALKAALKTLLRSHRLRCVGITVEPPVQYGEERWGPKPDLA